MSHQILVPIKGRDRIEELLPYLEVIARADMKIVFLVHFGVNRFAELAGQPLEIQSGLPANSSINASITQSNLTHRNEYVGRELRNRGVQIKVNFYSGRLRLILQDDQDYGNKRLIIMRPDRIRHGSGWAVYSQSFNAPSRRRPCPCVCVIRAALAGDSHDTH